MTKKTVGAVSLELIKGAADDTHSAHEQMSEQLQDYEKNFYQCVQDGKKTYDGTFFVVVLTKKERLMKNVLRNYFFHRSTCPTPEWDQAVYKCNKKSIEPEFLWVIPSKDTCEEMRHNPLEVAPSERQLLDFVLSLYDGSLLMKAKSLNGEVIDSPLLLK